MNITKTVFENCSALNGVGGGVVVTGPLPSDLCASCLNDYSELGTECCDTAWIDFGFTCARLESEMFWDCAQCACPGDNSGEFSNPNQDGRKIDHGSLHQTEAAHTKAGRKLPRRT